jgi:glutathione reductase (NADPH)
MTQSYDVLILGAGNAGMGAAGVTRAAGKSVAVVESWDVGGTCPLRGCVPKKVLVAAAQVMHQIDVAPVHHISVDKWSLDWGRLIAREREFVEGVPEAFAKSLEGRGIELLRGQAKFVGPNRVEIDGQAVEAGKIVIATGSKPRPLAIPGAELMITSNEILELAELPDSLIFIGGGVIALEFSHVFARAGCKVTILEALPRLLPRLEMDAVAKVHRECERIGIEILTGVTVEGVARRGAALEVSFQHQGGTRSFLADQVANGTGRIPDIEDLDLAAGGIEHDGLRIHADEHLRSRSNPDVYVGGDALWSSAQLSALATYEGRIIGENILHGDTRVPDYGHIPSAVYTVPALASVGLTEEEAREQGFTFAVKTNDMGDWRSSKTHAETVAYSKVLFEEGSERILGAHMVGHGSEEVIHLFAFAMKHGITASQLAETVYAYPTFSSDVKFMV